MSVRNALFYVHQYLGLFAIVFLIAAGATGSVLVFKDELDAGLNPDLFLVEGDARASVPWEVADGVQKSHPNLWVTIVRLRAGAGETLPLSVGARDGEPPLGFNEMYVDPQSGALVGVRANEPGWGRHQIVNGLFVFHADLLAGDFGRILMGFVALAWTVSGLAGLYLTFPQTAPFWPKWKRAWTFSFRSRLPRLMLDLHKSSGLWLFIGVTLLGATSVALNFYYEAVEPAVLALSPASPSPFDPGARSVPKDHRPVLTYSDVMPLAHKAVAGRAPDLEPTFAAYVPELGLYGVSFVSRDQDTYSSLGPIAYYFDDVSGDMIYVDDPYRDGAGRATLRSIYPLHSGRVWGWPTRIIVFILGIATVEMAITGFYVWWRRQGRSLFSRRAAPTPPPPDPSN